MEKTKKRAKIWLCIAIALMLLSGIVVSVVQTNGGKVDISELYFETDEGYTMCANLYVPENATAETPAPAIVASHGAYNNKEMQDANCVELARRGYVVLAIDQPSHGNTDVFPGSNGVYQGVLALSRMPYVDTTRIGVTGHSMGGMSCNNAVVQDNENGTNLIHAVVLNSADATYVDTTDTSLSDEQSTDYANIYGSRDVAIIACVYDEFFHKTTDENGNTLSAPYFMEGDNAQSFLYFGVDPTGLEPREADTIYTQEVDGEETLRAIYRPPIIHPWSHFSARSTAFTIEFFEESLGAPNPIDSHSQVWQWKEAFNFVGLIGLAMFIINFTVLMLFTPTFASLRADKLAEPVKVADKAGLAWYWIGMIVSSIFAMVTYLPILTAGNAADVTAPSPYGVGLWAAACGLFAILSMVVCYFAYSKKRGFNLVERGVKMSLPNAGKTILLAIIVVVVAYGCVFFVDYFFASDFRIWTLGVKTFNADKVWVSLFPYLPLFLIFYVASSVSVNAFNFNTVGGKHQWVNNVINSIMTASPALIMAAIQYGTYFTANHMMWAQDSFSGGNPPMYVLWLIQITFILFFATFMTRFIYKVSKNPYLPGIINGAMVCLISLTNTRFY